MFAQSDDSDFYSDLILYSELQKGVRSSGAQTFQGLPEDQPEEV